MDISLYLEPLELPDYKFGDEDSGFRMGDQIRSYIDRENFPDIDDVDIAIIGVNEERKAVNNIGCAHAPDYIRNHLYKLFRGDFLPRIADLGNIKQGHTIDDTYFALTSIISGIN